MLTFLNSWRQHLKISLLALMGSTLIGVTLGTLSTTYGRSEKWDLMNTVSGLQGVSMSLLESVQGITSLQPKDKIIVTKRFLCNIKVPTYQLSKVEIKFK